MIKINKIIDAKNPIGFNSNMLTPGLQFVLAGEIRYDLKMNDMGCICNSCCCPMKMKGFIPV